MVSKTSLKRKASLKAITKQRHQLIKDEEELRKKLKDIEQMKQERINSQNDENEEDDDDERSEDINDYSSDEELDNASIASDESILERELDIASDDDFQDFDALSDEDEADDEEEYGEETEDQNELHLIPIATTTTAVATSSGAKKSKNAPGITKQKKMEEQRSKKNTINKRSNVDVTTNEALVQSLNKFMESQKKITKNQKRLFHRLFTLHSR